MKKKRSVMIAVSVALLLLVSAAVPVLAQSEEELAVGSKPMIRGALAIRAPRVAPVGEKVTMTVFQRGTQEPVKDAGVWAFTREEAETLKEEWAGIREQSNVAPQEYDYELLVSVHGTFLGKTNGSGQLKHTFNEADGYLLIAVKRGYIPGFARIGIRTIPQTTEALES